MKLLAVLVVFLAIGGMVSAASIASAEEVIDLGDPTTVMIELNYTELTSEKVWFLIPSSHHPNNLRGFDRQGEIDCRFTSQGAFKEIECDPRDRGEYYVRINYTTPEPSSRAGSRLEMKHIRRVVDNLGSYRLRVILPEGYGLVESGDEASFSPDDARTGSEGRRIFIEWAEKDTTIGDRLEYTVEYQELEVLRDIFPGYYAAVLAVLVILAAVLGYLYVRKQRSRDTIAALMPVLKEDERNVLRFMVTQDGECEQKDLVDNLDYSKAKISRLVKDLEERNLIEKIKEGRKNRLVLKKDVGDLDIDGEDDVSPDDAG